MIIEPVDEQSNVVDDPRNYVELEKLVKAITYLVNELIWAMTTVDIADV